MSSPASCASPFDRCVSGPHSPLVAALALGRFVEAILFRVEPRDPVVFFSAAALMILVAMAAAVIPALRASAVNPATVLRGDG